MSQRIVNVYPGSLAARSGIREQDTLVSINATPVLDLVDYQFLTARASLELLIEDKNGEKRTVHIHKLIEEPLGITLESSLMSCPKTCANHCVFCFIEQMPPGMRESLYVRDDDWRLSLMAGNFVTLTNLPRHEMDRMIERKASPIYVSVHTTTGELRKKMLSHVHADRIMEHLRRFAENDMSFHCQIVLCPGINDGEELDRTLSDLASLMPHALTVALSANLLPGDELLSPVGLPYDTLQEVIGIRESPCSLAEYGVTYRQADLKADGSFDYDAIRAAINEKTKLVTIQRSKGYATRPTFSVSQIGELIAFCKSIKPDLLVMVDNCYGEFVETIEPSDVGADMVVGSLIKNPGGGLAPIGGYICGTEECVKRCAYRLSAPGLGQEVGANLGLMTALYQGFFMAPTVVAGAEKGAIFAANLYEPLGFRCVPNATESRHDIIQAVELGSEEGMIAFCKGIQAAAPVDSYATPMPWDMPGYNDKVIMAAGAFVQGSSIELSADGPIRPPYAVYFQGGLTWQHAKLGILMSLQKMVDANLTTI